MVRDAAWVNTRGEYGTVLVVVGAWMPISVFAYDQDRFTNVSDAFFDKPYNGLWNTMLVADLKSFSADLTT